MCFVTIENLSFGIPFDQEALKLIDFSALSKSSSLPCRFAHLDMQIAWVHLPSAADAILSLSAKQLSHEQQTRLTSCVQEFLKKTSEEPDLELAIKLLDHEVIHQLLNKNPELYLERLTQIHQLCGKYKHDLEHLFLKAIVLIPDPKCQTTQALYWAKIAATHLIEFKKINSQQLSLAHPQLVAALSTPPDFSLLFKLLSQMNKACDSLSFDQQTAETYCNMFAALFASKMKEDNVNSLMELAKSFSKELTKAQSAFQKNAFFSMIKKLMPHQKEEAKEFLPYFLITMSENDWKDKAIQGAGQEWVTAWLDDRLFDALELSKNVDFYQQFLTLCLKVKASEFQWEQTFRKFEEKCILNRGKQLEPEQKGKLTSTESKKHSSPVSKEMEAILTSRRNLLLDHLFKTFFNALTHANFIGREINKTIDLAACCFLALKIDIHYSGSLIKMILNQPEAFISLFTHPRIPDENRVISFELILNGLIQKLCDENKLTHFKLFQTLCLNFQKSLKENLLIDQEYIEFFDFCLSFSELFADEPIFLKACLKIKKFFENIKTPNTQFFETYANLLIKPPSKISSERAKQVIEIIIDDFLPKCTKAFKKGHSSENIPLLGNLIVESFTHHFSLNLALYFLKAFRQYSLSNALFYQYFIDVIKIIVAQAEKSNLKEEIWKTIGEELSHSMTIILRTPDQQGKIIVPGCLKLLSIIYKKDELLPLFKNFIKIQLECESTIPSDQADLISIEKGFMATMLTSSLGYMVDHLSSSDPLILEWLELIYQNIIESLEYRQIADFAKAVTNGKKQNKRAENRLKLNLIEDMLKEKIPLNVRCEYKLREATKVLKKNPAIPPSFALFEMIAEQVIEMASRVKSFKEISNVFQAFAVLPRPDAWIQSYRSKIDLFSEKLCTTLVNCKLAPDSVHCLQYSDEITGLELPEFSNEEVISLLTQNIENWTSSLCQDSIESASSFLCFSSKGNISKKKQIFIKAYVAYPVVFLNCCKKLFLAAFHSNSEFSLKTNMIRNYSTPIICNAINLLKVHDRPSHDQPSFNWESKLAFLIQETSLSVIQELKNKEFIKEDFLIICDFLLSALFNDGFIGNYRVYLNSVEKLFPFIGLCKNEEDFNTLSSNIKDLLCSKPTSLSLTIEEEKELSNLLKKWRLNLSKIKKWPTQQLLKELDNPSKMAQ